MTRKWRDFFLSPQLCLSRSAAAVHRPQLRLKRRNPHLQRLVFLAREPCHVLDRLELLALHNIEVAQHLFRLVSPERVDFALDTLCRAGCIVHQPSDLVEKPVCGLGHGRFLRTRKLQADNGDPPGFVQVLPIKSATSIVTWRRLALSYCPFPAIVFDTNGKEHKDTRSSIMIDQQIDIPTSDGKTTTFITHPERGGPFPAIIFYMDAPAIREELRDMARRLATSGYYVMLPNLYYRSGVMELGPINPDPESPERKRMVAQMNSISIPLVMEDTRALLAYAEGQSAANTRIVGTVGYCMSGRYAVNAATHFPDRVKAAASIYGTHLATDQADSPHLAAGKTGAELYFACAETDVYAPPDIIAKVQEGMTGARAEVEIYPGTHHGFAFPKRPVYDRDAAERHWERLLALYRRNLV